MEVNKCNTLEEFETILQNHEMETYTKYVVIKCPKVFSAEHIEIRPDQKLHWQDDIPFLHFGTKTYYCHQGVDTNISGKRKYAQDRDRKGLTRSIRKITSTKKLDCPARFTITRVIQMPEYKCLGSSKNEKDKISKKIKSKILAQEPVGEECYIFNLPKPSDHKFHFVGMNVEHSELVLDETVLVEKESEHFQSTDCVENEVEIITTELEINTTANQHGEIKLRGNTKKHAVSECNSIVRSLQSIFWCLEEDKLKSLSTSLKHIFDEYSSFVTEVSASGLPIELKSARKARTSLKFPRSKFYSKPLHHTKKGFQGSIKDCLTANMLRGSVKSKADDESTRKCIKRQRSFKLPQGFCKRVNIVKE